MTEEDRRAAVRAMEDNHMPVNDPKDLRPPVKCKSRPVARQLSEAEIKAAADRAEARSIRAATQVANDPPKIGVGLAATRVIEG
jgi:hypothetical protein